MSSAKYQQIFIYFVPPKYPFPPFSLPAWNYDNREPPEPAAWSYDNLVGAIWLEGNPAGYDNSHTGQIGVREPSGIDELGQAQGGNYDNRA